MLIVLEKTIQNLKVNDDGTTIQTSTRVNTDEENISTVTPAVKKLGDDNNGEFISCAVADLLIGTDCNYKVLYKVKDGHFHDGKCDSRGRFWAGKWKHEVGDWEHPVKYGGSLCSIEKGCIKEFEPAFTGTNGLCLSPAEDMVYTVDSLEHEIIAQKFNVNSGTVEPGRNVLFTLPYEEFGFDKKTILDGMVSDIKGNLWVVAYIPGKVLNIDVETGKVINQITLSEPLVTSLCFGGPNLSELYVTSCFEKLPNWSDHITPGPNGGHTFKVTLEKDNMFKGTLMHDYVK